MPFVAVCAGWTLVEPSILESNLHIYECLVVNGKKFWDRLEINITNTVFIG